jgi:hypothetical protein
LELFYKKIDLFKKQGIINLYIYFNNYISYMKNFLKIFFAGVLVILTILWVWTLINIFFGDVATILFWRMTVVLFFIAQFYILDKEFLIY